MTKKTVKKTPLKIPTLRFTTTSYAIVGRRRGKLVWYCSHKLYSDQPPHYRWSVSDGWAMLFSDIKTARRTLKRVRPDAGAIQDVSLVKLTRTEVNSGRIVK